MKIYRFSMQFFKNLLSIFIIVAPFVLLIALSVEIQGSLQVNILNQDNQASELLIKKADGTIGKRDVLSLPTSAVLSLGIILRISLFAYIAK